MDPGLYHYYDNQWNNDSKQNLKAHIQLVHLQITKRRVFPSIWARRHISIDILSFKKNIYSIYRLLLDHCGVYIFLISNIWPPRCGCTFPLHAHKPRQPSLPCAHADPWSGERGQSLALGQEPRPRGPERGGARQQDGVRDLLDEATSNEGAIYNITICYFFLK